MCLNVLNKSLTWRLSRLCLTGDGDEDFDLYPTDILDGDPSQSLALTEDLASPTLSEDEISPHDHLSFHHHSMALTPEDMSVPVDFELRESSVPHTGLGIWTHRKVEVGERFGPYVGEHTACLLDPTQGWEVGQFWTLAYDTVTNSLTVVMLILILQSYSFF